MGKEIFKKKQFKGKNTMITLADKPKFYVRKKRKLRKLQKLARKTERKNRK